MTNDKSCRWTFAAALILVAFYCLNFPSASWRAEPFAETATDYFLNANALGFWQNLRLPEFAHLPWGSRMIAWLAVRLPVSVSWYGTIVQMASVVLIALSAATINLSIFSALLPSQAVRFVVSLMVGLHWGWGMFLLHNLGYWGVVPGLALALGYCARAVPRSQQWGMGLLCALLLPGKAYALAFLPFFAWHLVVALYQRSSKILIYAVALAPLCMLAWHNLENAAAPIPFRVLISNTLHFVTFLLPHVLFGQFVAATMLPLPACLLWASQLSGVVVLAWQKRYRLVGMVLVLWVVMLVSVAMTVKGFYPARLDFWTPHHFEDDSHFFYPAVATLLASVALFVGLARVAALQAVFLAVLVCGSSVFAFVRPQDPFAAAYSSVGAWRAYAGFLSDPSYCIPINPHPWMLLKDCVLIGSAAAGSSPDRLVARGKVRLVLVDNLPGRNVSTIRVLAADGQLRQLPATSPADRRKVGFYFQPPLVAGESFELLDDLGMPVNVSPDQVLLYGN